VRGWASTYLRREAGGDAGKVLHLLAQTGPGHGAVGADAHVARGGDDEGELEGLHGEARRGGGGVNGCWGYEVR